MANHCFNWVNIYGKDRTLNRIVSKLETYHDHKGTFLSWGDIVLNKEPEEGEEEREYYYYGTRWWDFEIQRERGEINVSGDSAWSPPIELIKQICVEYGVTATIEYEEPGCDFGGKTEFDELGEIVEEIEMPYNEWRYHSDPEYLMLNIVSDMEDSMEFYNSEDDVIKDYPFLNKQDTEYIIEEYNKIKNKCNEKSEV
jgi:hypothetical protein